MWKDQHGQDTQQNQNMYKLLQTIIQERIPQCSPTPGTPKPSAPSINLDQTSQA